ncbi:MAG: DUF2889 domain-containing protein [Rhodospirillaceae bacterium]|nr:MAG: DUF2889 domain-containing protein [Rhodospirillaceae bacterium]
MPLPTPTVARTSSHTRQIVCEGFERADGLFDIDGWLTDVKGAPFVTPFRGTLSPGEPQHSLGLRITIDGDFLIKDVIAVMDATPSDHCFGAVPNFAKLIGLKLSGGFNRTARTVIERTLGCTHLIDLLGPMATTALQTVWAKNPRRFLGSSKDPKTPPPMVNSCRGWADDGEMVANAFPQFYTGPANVPPKH